MELFPAYPSAKSLDEARAKMGSGQEFYHSVISGTDFAAQPYIVRQPSGKRHSAGTDALPMVGIRQKLRRAE